jgi:hypothetical protein
MYLQNHIIDFVRAAFIEANHTHVRAVACNIDASGEAAKVRSERNAAKLQRAEENWSKQAKSIAKKETLAAKLAGVHLEQSAIHLAGLKNPKLDNQINKIRSFDLGMPAKSNLKMKALKLAAIKAALIRLVETERQLQEGTKGRAGESLSMQEATAGALQTRARAVPDDVELMYQPAL